MFHRLLQWKEKWRHSFHYLRKPPHEAQPALLTSASSPLPLCNFTRTPFICIYYIIISLHALILRGEMKVMWTFDDDRSLELDAADTLRPPQAIINALFYMIISLHFWFFFFFCHSTKPQDQKSLPTFTWNLLPILKQYELIVKRSVNSFGANMYWRAYCKMN